MNHLRQFLKRALVWAVTGTLVLPAPLYAASTDISDGPLAQPATSVKPNMMLIVDDSGSMARQFTPDYLHSNSQAGTVANCFDALDSGAAITSTPEECYPGDPPMHSPDFNTQYYNPEIRYFPAVTYDGTSKGEMDATATTNWTAVPTDNVSVSTNNVARKSIHLPVNANSSSNDTTLDWAKRIPSPALQTMDLVNGFPDRLWCNAVTPANTSSTNCKTNSGYTYPEFTFGYGKDSSGNRRYVLGAPYYYRIEATEHCTDANMTTCVSSTSPTTVAGVNYPVPAPIRFCNSTAMTNCQAKRSGSYIYPKFLGTIAASVAGSPGAKSVGTIRLATTGNTLDSGAPTVTLIRLTTPDLTTVDVVSSSTLLSATNSGAGRVSAMSTLRTAINAGAHGYKACVSGTDATFPDGTACGGTSGTDLRIQAPAVGVANDGTQIAVTAPVTSTTPASLTFAISSARSGDSVNTLAFVINGVTTNLITSAVSCPSCTTSNSSSSNNNALAGAVRSAITSAATGFTSSGSGANVTITAPTTTGSELNNIALVWSDSGLTDVSASLSGGISVGDLSHSTINFGSGANAVAAATAQRLNTGSFVRTNIVSGQTYTKYPARSDCTGSACSYDEEMTNFANWFAYYRTRIQMARTSLGRAFLVLGSSFRVGIMSINFSTTHYLAVNDFTTTAGGQKSQWYDKLYNIMTVTTGGTPLRQSLSRAGQYYAGKRGCVGVGCLSNDMGASPIQLACQPSYTILTSDGTWNDASTDADDLAGSSVGNQDSGTGTPAAEISPYATKASGSWDGNKATNTLADVAMYYYKTDLRTDLADQVPPSGIDVAPHQHMTTFTVGMGLAGTLNYDPNYQEQQSGDFFDIKQGTKLWPVPASNNETAIDDLWHAAVNGRGRFFSAQDPVTLADGISETLNSVQARIGAGAAAATSNLQPIAGDNFAFTAQYQTVEWSGDLKARTIDLSTGAVAQRELWSAQFLLDQRVHTSRRIYTYDAGDTDATANVTVASVSRAQNANRMRSFCPKDTDTATNPNCDDGGLLTTSEMNDYFDPDGGVNSALDQAGTWAGDGTGRAALATPTNLIQFLRGDAANEMVSVTANGNTDLYRNRAHLLGDIVNAQPAYVKLPPFNYSDPFYSDFKTANATRSGRVYAAANDGMLHAFITDADNNPYYQTAGIATSITSDDTFTGTQSTDATTGDGAENWAYIPGLVIPKIKRLAEAYYSSNHAYTVDGTPVIADVCFGHSTAAPCSAANKWRTVLVAGLNNGGNGYYALDVTDPVNPKALWELKGGADAACIAADADVTATSGQTEDCNIGKSFGNPIIAKLPANYVDSAHRGKWVAIVTSGHNNIPAVSGAGDGKGHFYIVEVETGKILNRKSTPAGDTATPSGLSRINAWVDASSTDNTALTIYGGDLMGNLWRYQLDSVTNTSPDDSITSGSLTLLATVKDPSNVVQPITTRPELGEVLGNRVIYVATGKFLGLDDKTSFQRQTVYAIKDQMNRCCSAATVVTDMTRTGAGATSTISGFVRQTLAVDTSNASLRTVKDPVTGTANTVNFATDKGFFIDLPDGGASATDPSERVNVDPILQLGTLVVPSNVPSSDTCVAGGFGWVNFFDYRSGSYVPGATSNAASQKISASLIVGINVVQLPGGTVKTIVTTADNQQLTKDTPVASSSVTGRRVSWRELFVE